MIYPNPHMTIQNTWLGFMYERTLSYHIDIGTWKVYTKIIGGLCTNIRNLTGIYTRKSFVNNKLVLNGCKVNIIILIIKSFFKQPPWLITIDIFWNMKGIKIGEIGAYL